MGQLLLFLCETSATFLAYIRGVLGTNRFSHFVIDWLVCFGYSANNSTRGAFPILFLICSDLLNCLRNLGTMYITAESGSNSLNVIFTEQFLTEVYIFRCSDICSVRPPQIFQVQAKTSRVRPVFPGYLPFLVVMPERCTLSSETIFGNWAPFKNGKKLFLFHFKNSVRSEDI